MSGFELTTDAKQSAQQVVAKTISPTGGGPNVLDSGRMNAQPQYSGFGFRPYQEYFVLGAKMPCLEGGQGS